MKKKILLVDDEQMTLKLIKQMLIDKYEVESFTDGYDALSLLDTGYLPDVFVFDLNMPSISGYELVQMLKAKSELANIPLIILTGENDESERTRCYKLGVQDFLNKPILPDVLKLTIEDLLNR